MAVRKPSSRREFLKRSGAAGLTALAGPVALVADPSGRSKSQPGATSAKAAENAFPVSAADGSPGAEPWRRSYMQLPNVVGDADGVPIYAYGQTFIYGVSPDFESGVTLQQGN